MTVKIGTVIKKLRRAQKVTQDELAAALGVTPQAISRWESENGYPDIELLPLIADYFSVSVDELIGYKKSEREAELTRIKREMIRLKETGTPEERIVHARNALIRFPGDDEIKNALAVSLFLLYEEKRDTSALVESETLCKSLVERSTDPDVKYDAVNTLIAIYRRIGNPEKAYETAQLLTPLKYCRELSLSGGIGDGKTEWYIQDAIDKLTYCLGASIQNLALNEELPNDETTWNRKIDMLITANEIYRLIYGDNLMIHHARIARNYWLISTYLIAQGKKSETLAALEKMCEHTLAYDRSCEEDHGMHYSSIFTDVLVYPETVKDSCELTEHNQSYYRLDYMNAPRYDCIREEDRFKRIIKKMEEHAR